MTRVLLMLLVVVGTVVVPGAIAALIVDQSVGCRDATLAAGISGAVATFLMLSLVGHLGKR